MPEYENVAVSPESKRKLQDLCDLNHRTLKAQAELLIDDAWWAAFVKPQPAVFGKPAQAEKEA